MVCQVSGGIIPPRIPSVQEYDYSLFIKHKHDKLTILVVYVDDIIMIGDDDNTIQELKKHLDDIFSIKDLGRLSYFLRIEVGYIEQGITLTQSKFTKELLLDAGIDGFRSVVTPLPLNIKLRTDEG